MKFSTLILILCFITGLAIAVSVNRGDITAEPVNGRVDSAGIALPEATGYVTDLSNIIGDATEEGLEAQLKQLADSGNGEIAVLTIPSTSPLTIEDFSIRLAEKWRVGKSDNDNGVIFIVATDDRKLRVEIGRGAEAHLTDAQAGVITDTYIVPFLKENKWEEGIVAGTNALINAINK